MIIRIHKEGHGWYTYAARRFDWTRAVNEWADDVGPMFRESLKEVCPVNTRPHFDNNGRLRDSITFERSTAVGDAVRIEFTANTPYARYVLGGTLTHVIEPVAAKALHWWDRPYEGREYFASRVIHPGQQPNHFPSRAMDRDRDEITRRFVNLMQRHLAEALEE